MPHGYVAVAGPGEADAELTSVAEEVGRRLAEAGAVVVTGGLGGVMEAACRGASAAGGMTVGILPGTDRAAANPYVEVALATGMGEARNALVACAADALVAVGGEWGTLSEIALARKAGKPVATLWSWELARAGAAADGIAVCESPAQAVAAVLDALAAAPGSLRS